MANSVEQTQPLVSFKDPDSLQSWFSVNDGVMGGISEGGFSRTQEGTLRFSGNLSLANNGGFSSIRNRLPAPLPPTAVGLLLKVRGDGRDYWLDLRRSRQNSGTSYRAALSTSGAGMEEIYLPLAQFNFTSFGRRVAGRPLNPGEIQSVGFTLSDKKEGPFELDIASIEVVLADSHRPVSAPTAASLILMAIDRGVPQFNQGNPAACRAIYEMTCSALLNFPELSEKSKRDLSIALQQIRITGDESEKAWILRYSMDRALEELDEINNDR